MFGVQLDDVGGDEGQSPLNMVWDMLRFKIHSGWLDVWAHWAWYHGSL